MKYRNYHLETPKLDRRLKALATAQQKIDIWNTFVDSDLTDVQGDDFSIVPRVLPASYFPVISKSARLITEFCLKLLSLPEKEIRAIIPRGPVRDHLLDELEVLRHRKGRITGSFRFDMAIVGAPSKDNPPVLLEINEIGFDGLSRSSYFQKVLLELMPSLRKRLRALDTSANEVRNMMRLGPSCARIQYDTYNWDEEYLLKTSKRLGADVRLICPENFGLDVDREECPLLEVAPLRVRGGHVDINGWRPSSLNMSFAYELEDYEKGHDLYKEIVRAKTPQYGPFLTGLVAAKTILCILADPVLRKRLMGAQAKALGKSILSAHLLSDCGVDDPARWVIKHTDGFGGKQVFMDEELERTIKRVPARLRHEWVLQQKTKLNLIDVDGILSRKKQAIADLGVFVEYDWDGEKFTHFEVGGLMSRATNKSLKVNVSSGGLQVAVLLDRES